MAAARVAFVVFVALTGTACASAYAGSAPFEGRLARGARAAAIDPWTYVPVVAACAIAIADVDEEISDWAIEHEPVGAVLGDAEMTSHAALGLAAVGAGLPAAMPLRGRSCTCRQQRMEAVGLGTGIALLTTHAGKHGFQRPRPTGPDSDAMPSGHQTAVAALTALGRRNLPRSGLSRGTQRAWRAGLDVLPLVSGWCRIEAGRHYATDVLVGQAVGNFFGVLVDTVHVRPRARLRPYVDGSRRGGDTRVRVGLQTDL